MIAFRCYDPSDDGSGGIHRWYNTLPDEIRGEIDAVLEAMQLETSLASHRFVEAMCGACKGLSRITFKVNFSGEEIHIRILGFDGPERRQFTLLRGFEKQADADYGRMCWAAHRQKEGVEHDGSRAPPCQFP
jgi:hypothetical protein